MLVGGLDGVVGPEALGPHLERRRLRKRDVVLDHDGAAAVLAHQAGPVPGDPEVRVEPEPHVAAEGSLAVSEVEVPRLAPELLRAGLVVALVGRLDDRAGPDLARRGRVGHAYSS